MSPTRQPSSVSRAAARLAAWLRGSRTAGTTGLSPSARSEKENLYRALFHNTLDGVYLVQGSRLVLGNAALARMVGVESAARLTGRDLREFIAPEEWPPLQERLARRLQGEDPLPPITLTVVRRDGTRIRVQFSGALIQYEGQPTIVGVARDVSEAERAAAEAQRIHKVYMLGIEALGGVPYTLDIAAGRYDFLGGDIAAMTGFTPEELTPQRFQRQIIRMDFQTNTGQLSREEVLRKRPDKLQAYYLFERKDGRRIWLFDASTPEFAPDGKFTRSFGILQDVTEARSIQERVRVYADLGRELNAANTALDAARVIARAAERLIDHDACAVVLFAENMTIMRTIYLSDTFEGVRREVDPSGPDIPLSSLAQQVLNNGKVLLLLKPGDHLMGYRFGDTSRESASVIAAQLRLGHRAVGYLTLQSYRYNNYDVDEFKQINDTHGHPVGDAVLARAGVIIRDIIRTSDIAARYGGDEFCIILPQTDLEGARVLAERIRKALANATFSDQVAALQVTCSVGISRLGGNITNHSTLLNSADRALYQAKRLGRNRTEVVDSLTSV